PRVNTIFISVSDPNGDRGPRASAEFNRLLSDHWQLDDLHLRLVPNRDLQYLSLESDRMILDRQTAGAAGEVARQLGCETSPVLAYIANKISLVGRDNDADSDQDSPYSRYSIVAGLDPDVFAHDARPPFGPFRFQDPA